MTTPSLPARWRPWQRRKNTAIYHAVRAAHAGRFCLPPRRRLTLGRALGFVAWALAWPQRRLANRQLAAAMPALGARARRRTVRQMFVHLGETVAELLDLTALVRASPLDACAERVLRDALAEGRGVLAVSGHLGNWELLAQAVAARGVPLALVAKPLSDPRLTAWVDAERRRFGAEVLWRSGVGEVRPVLRALAANKVVALLLDQDTRVPGVHVPFFHAPAHTPRAVAALALRRGTPVVVATSWRVGRRHRYCIERLDVAREVAERPDAEPVVALTAAFAARLERAVRAHPAQWVWLHARWRRRASARAVGAGPGAESEAKPVAEPCHAGRAGVAVVLALAALLCGTPVAAGPRAGATNAKAPPLAEGGQVRAVNFRCDGLQLLDRGRRVRCTGNVVLREQDLLVCCDALDAEADVTGSWRAVHCVGGVRVAQQDARVWAERADYAPQQGLLTLRGAPQLQRGRSVLHGEQVRLWRGVGAGDGAGDGEVLAEIDRPRGLVQAADAPPAANARPAPNPESAPAWSTGPLPPVCPLPGAPAGAP